LHCKIGCCEGKVALATAGSEMYYCGRKVALAAAAIEMYYCRQFVGVLSAEEVSFMGLHRSSWLFFFVL